MHNRCIYPIPRIRGLRHQVLTCPGTGPSMQFLFVGSHLCTRASFRQILADLPLPSASGYASISDTPTGDFHPIRSCPCRAYTTRCSRHPQAGAAERGRCPGNVSDPRNRKGQSLRPNYRTQDTSQSWVGQQHGPLKISYQFW